MLSCLLHRQSASPFLLRDGQQSVDHAEGTSGRGTPVCASWRVDGTSGLRGQAEVGLHLDPCLSMVEDSPSIHVNTCALQYALFAGQRPSAGK
jgi:hypothetical protein